MIIFEDHALALSQSSGLFVFQLLAGQEPRILTQIDLSHAGVALVQANSESVFLLSRNGQSLELSPLDLSNLTRPRVMNAVLRLPYHPRTSLHFSGTQLWVLNGSRLLTFVASGEGEWKQQATNSVGDYDQFAWYEGALYLTFDDGSNVMKVVDLQKGTVRSTSFRFDVASSISIHNDLLLVIDNNGLWTFDLGSPLEPRLLDIQKGNMAGHELLYAEPFRILTRAPDRVTLQPFMLAGGGNWSDGEAFTLGSEVRLLLPGPGFFTVLGEDLFGNLFLDSNLEFVVDRPYGVLGNPEFLIATQEAYYAVGQRAVEVFHQDGEGALSRIQYMELEQSVESMRRVASFMLVNFDDSEQTDVWVAFHDGGLDFFHQVPRLALQFSATHDRFLAVVEAGVVRLLDCSDPFGFVESDRLNLVHPELETLAVSQFEDMFWVLQRGFLSQFRIDQSGTLTRLDQFSVAVSYEGLAVSDQQLALHGDGAVDLYELSTSGQPTLRRQAAVPETIDHIKFFDDHLGIFSSDLFLLELSGKYRLFQSGIGVPPVDGLQTEVGLLLALPDQLQACKWSESNEAFTAALPLWPQGKQITDLVGLLRDGQP